MSQEEAKKDTETKIAERVIELQKQLADEEISLQKKMELQKELDFAKTKTSLEAIQAIKDYQAKTETEKILFAQQKKDEQFQIDQEKIQIELTNKIKALDEEQSKLKSLQDTKISFEIEFQKLFLKNANERNLSIEQSIKAMQRLNSLSSNSSST